MMMESVNLRRLLFVTLANKKSSKLMYNLRKNMLVKDLRVDEYDVMVVVEDVGVSNDAREGAGPT